MFGYLLKTQARQKYGENGIVLFLNYIFDPQNQKTYLRTYAPREASEQPAQSRSLISIYIGTFWLAKDAKVLLADNEDSLDCADEQAD